MGRRRKNDSDSPDFPAVPVFPLPDLVVFPGADVPLHFFEPRYRALAEDVVDSDGLFVTVRLEPGYQDDYHGRPPIKRIGTLGRIVAHRARPDGTHDVVFRGLSRCVLDELTPSDRGYRVAAVTLRPDVGIDRITSGSVATLVACAQSLAAIVRKRHADFSLGIERIESPADLVDSLAHRVVLAPDDRQRLLETRDVRIRVARLVEMMGEIVLRFGVKAETQN